MINIKDYSQNFKILEAEVIKKKQQCLKQAQNQLLKRFYL